MTLRQTENVQLISLDPYNVFLISFKEVKRAREKGRKNEKVRERVYFLSFMSVITVLNIISENFFYAVPRFSMPVLLVRSPNALKLFVPVS
jgi:hypothetical protein